MRDEYTAAAALLHDVVEDTDITFDDLLREGIPEKVVDALRLLTHEEGTDYFDYVRRIKQNPIAAAVKYADLCHNSDLTRFAGEEIDEWARARGEKYEKAKKILLED
jgi:(p)ppGpp synthase/HD superfamily hydrolase